MRRSRPHPDEVSIAVAVAEKVSRELDEDYVGLWVLPWHIRHDWPEASDDKVRSLARSILRALTSRDVVLGDLDGDTVDFLPWSVDDSVDAAMEMWERLGRDPTIGEIAWLERPVREQSISELATP
jgi:hypothetical protein